jgi:prepilin-type N-terminal cleavage/methylation domain-containing protein
MKQRGFTLIELMITFAIIAILIMVALPAIIGSSSKSNISIGVNGMTESRCIEGYKFIIDQKGNSRQILDEFGKGVKCENANVSTPGSFKF